MSATSSPKKTTELSAFTPSERSAFSATGSSVNATAASVSALIVPSAPSLFSPHTHAQLMSHDETEHDELFARSLVHTEAAADIIGDQKGDRKEYARINQRNDELLARSLSSGHEDRRPLLVTPPPPQYSDVKYCCDGFDEHCPPEPASSLTHSETEFLQANKMRMCKINSLAFFILLGMCFAYTNFDPKNHTDEGVQVGTGRFLGTLLSAFTIFGGIIVGHSCTNGRK